MISCFYVDWTLFEIEMWHFRYSRCCRMYESGNEWVNECIWISCCINLNDFIRGIGCLILNDIDLEIIYIYICIDWYTSSMTQRECLYNYEQELSM